MQPVRRPQGDSKAPAVFTTGDVIRSNGQNLDAFREHGNLHLLAKTIRRSSLLPSPALFLLLPSAPRLRANRRLRPRRIARAKPSMGRRPVPVVAFAQERTEQFESAEPGWPGPHRQGRH